MRKTIFTLCMAALSSPALADNEQTTIDASKVSKITFDGDKVNITYNDGSAADAFDMAEIIISFSGTSGMKEGLKVEKEEPKGDWYDLKGRKLTGKPSSKGIYINNGKKAVIK